jgi:gluconolactonase
MRSQSLILTIFFVTACSTSEDPAMPVAADAGISMDASAPADASAPVDAGRPPDAGPRDPLEGVVAPTLIQNGYGFTEGAVWRTRGVFQFVDLSTDRLYEVNMNDEVRVSRPRTGGAVGLIEDAEGNLLIAGHWARRIASMTDDTLPEVLVGTFEGSRFNSPNDLVLATSGDLYFTDPPFGIDPSQRDLDFHGVFRRAADGTLSAEYRGDLSFMPNGIELSPDERTLYVSHSRGAALYQFSIAADGSLGDRELFVTTGVGPDGLAVDQEGNVYVATVRGVEVSCLRRARWSYAIHHGYRRGLSKRDADPGSLSPR